MKKIKDLDYTPINAVDSNQSVENAIRLMHEKKTNLLLVTEKGRGVGVLTSGTLFNQFYLHAGVHFPEDRFRGPSANLDLQELKFRIFKERLEDFKKVKISDMYSHFVRYVRLDEDVSRAVHLMKSLNLRRLVVTDEQGKYIGILDRTTVLNAIFNP